MSRPLLALLMAGALWAPDLFAAPATSFMQPQATLEPQARMDFVLGQAIFDKIWVQAPSSTTASDGLGPLYNARSCRQCHINNGRGRPPYDASDPTSLPRGSTLPMLLRLSIPAHSTQQQTQARTLGVVPEPTYGTQLQTFAIPGLPAEGQVALSYTHTEIELPDGIRVELRQPTIGLDNPAYGIPDPALQLSLRIAPPMIGLGLLQQISEQQLLRQADPLDSDGDGISGRPNRVWDLSQQAYRIGRFGWKAGQPNLAQQNASALVTDIGIGNAIYPAPQGDCSARQLSCLTAPNGNTPEQGGQEASAQMLAVLNHYTANLRVPPARDAEDPLARQGHEIFNRIGCQRCHTEYQNIQQEGRPALTLRPFSDLLLHDMGPGLADGRPEFDANGQEWRTPPLWGIGLTHRVNGNTYYLHDGRARTLLEAVLWHGGEARTSRDRAIALPTSERQALIRFLESL